jgi:hypothetical protein
MEIILLLLLVVIALWQPAKAMWAGADSLNNYEEVPSEPKTKHLRTFTPGTIKQAHDAYVRAMRDFVKQDYEFYIRESPVWQRKRKLQLVCDNYTCQICGETDTPLEVHHTSYQHLYQEPVGTGNIVTLCKECHSALHAYYPKNVGYYPINYK